MSVHDTDVVISLFAFSAFHFNQRWMVPDMSIHEEKALVLATVVIVHPRMFQHMIYIGKTILGRLDCLK